MNIAIVSPFNPNFVRSLFDKEKIDIPDIHGNASAVNILVTALIDLGHKVFVYTTINIGDNTKVLYGHNIKVCIISKEFHPRGMSNLRVVKRIRKTISQDIDSLDVIHAHWSYEYAAAARYFDRQKPVFCTIRDWCPYQRSLVKTIGEKYSWWLNSLLFKYVMKSYRVRFIANSTYTYEMTHTDYPDRNIKIIPNPVQRQYIIPEIIQNKRQYSFITICQSPEERRKNIDTLLKAFQIYRKKKPKSKLVIVGFYTEDWRRVHIDLLDGVFLAGAISHDEVYKYLDDSAVLVHPSLEETFGNILLEAMARRVICIGGKKSGAVPEVLGRGKYGVLCDMENEDDIVNAMVLTEDKLYVNKVVQAASEYVINSYADDIIAKKHIELYEEEIGNFHKKQGSL